MVALALVGCSSSPAIDLSDPDYLEDISGSSQSLGGRVDLARLELAINYPEGWHAESAGPFTTITWDRSEVTRWFGGDDLEGPLVFFEVESFDFMRGMGFSEARPTPEGLLEFSTRTFGWDQIRDEVAISLFGGEGLQVRGRDPRGEFVAIQGVLPEERTILIMVIAPTAAELDELLVTWRAMVDTIGEGAEQEVLSAPL